MDFFSTLTIWDYIYAALMAFLFTSLILRFKNIKSMISNDDELSIEHKDSDMVAILKRCQKMFPIDTVLFNGQVFKSGSKVRITTLQKKVIEGELIGKNELNILCVLTNRHIIAHEIEKIEDMINV